MADAKDPERVAASRILVEDASRGDDPDAWKARAETHIELAPDDVRVLVQLAHVELRAGPDRAERALALVEQGLDALGPEGSTTRRLDLLKSRAIAAHMLAPPEAPQETRDRLARFAREWLLASRDAGKPIDDPLLACTNAGRSESWCTGEAEGTR